MLAGLRTYELAVRKYEVGCLLLLLHGWFGRRRAYREMRVAAKTYGGRR